MKPFTTILFSLLLLLTPFASLQTVAANCPPAKRMICCHAGCHMACCEQQNSNSAATPTVPTQKDGAQDQVSLFALVVVVYSLPESSSLSVSPVADCTLTSARTPLYTRHCALLL